MSLLRAIGPSGAPLGAGAGGVELSTFYLFATALAAGTIAVLPLVPLAAIGRRFFVLMSLIAVVFYALATASRGLEIDTFHVAGAAILIAYNVTLSEKHRALGAALLWAAIGCGGAGLVRDAIAGAGSIVIGGPQGLWLALVAVASALVLGGGLVAMLLGHWYLVAHALSFDVLRRVVVVLIAALVARTALVAAAAAAQSALWSGLYEEAGGWTPLFFSPGLYVGARCIFGIIVPLILAWMAYSCVKIRSNQSATGILYVVVAFTILGEALARHLLVADGILA